MNNLVISIVYLLLTFSLTVLIYKKAGRVGLYIFMSVSVIISNIETIKLIDFYGVVVSLGNISYGSIFLITDILSEKYGKESCKKAIRFSFLMMIIFTISMKLFLAYTPSSIDNSNEALLTIFNYMPRITIASLLAYYISSNCDAYLYSYFKSKFNKLFISNNLSTFISQIIDTFIFCTISFFNTMSLKELVTLGISMLVFKWLIALLDTPFMYLANSIKKVEEL